MNFMPKNFSEKEQEILLMGLKLYRVQIKKMLDNSEKLKAGEKEIKKTFLEVETLVAKLSV